VSGFRTTVLRRRLSTSLPSLYLYVLHCMLKSYSLSRAKGRFIFFYNQPVAKCILDVTKTNRNIFMKFNEPTKSLI
jgi:hypothetical protein